MTTIITAVALFALAMLPLVLAGTGKIKNKKLALVLNIISVFSLCVGMLAFGVVSNAADEAA